MEITQNENIRVVDENRDYEDIIQRVVKNVQSGEGSVQMLSFYHDDWCPKLKGGTCRCNPDIKLKVLA
jgi:hypothetical protein